MSFAQDYPQRFKGYSNPLPKSWTPYAHVPVTPLTPRNGRLETKKPERIKEKRKNLGHWEHGFFFQGPQAPEGPAPLAVQEHLTASLLVSELFPQARDSVFSFSQGTPSFINQGFANLRLALVVLGSPLSLSGGKSVGYRNREISVL